jgi:hemoglobin-like flavoprotein
MKEEEEDKRRSCQKSSKTCYEHSTYELLKSFYARTFRRRKELVELFTMQSGIVSEQDASSATGFRFDLNSLTLSSVAILN